jgi:hypothetical protein
MAETFIGALCPRTSMALVVAITGMVAWTTNCVFFDPVACGERHDALLVAMCVVFPSEAYAVTVEAE